MENMSRKILILKGSPRQHGNSATLAEQAAVGASENGAQVESIILHDLDIRPCDGCDSCVDTGVCVIKDDMQPIYSKIMAVDALVLASPIYWFTYTAQLKTCIDRWYALWNYNHTIFKNKPFGFILTYGDADLHTSGGINAIHTFETMCRFLQADVAGWVHGSLSEIGDAQKHPELMKKAYQLGRKLAQESG